MAQILPTAPTGATTPEIARVFQRLRRLPDDQYFVWQRLAFWDEPGPDFWVMNERQQALLLKISPATRAQVKAALQPTLLDSIQPDVQVGAAEVEALAAFVTQLGFTPLTAPLPCLVLFPNLSAVDLERLPPANGDDGIHWVSKEVFTPKQFPNWIATVLGQPLSPRFVASLRQAFTPEVVIPATFTTRKPTDRNVAAGLTEQLLDYRQEVLLKNDLDLPTSARGTVNDFKIRLVNGVAGSGKSLIIIYRVHLLRKLFPNKKILVLTHNRPLIRDLQGRYEQLSRGDKSVSWYTFMGWCRRYWPVVEPWQGTVSWRKRERIITPIWHEHLADTAVTAKMLLDEIDWVKDRLIFSRDAYLAADRTGRGFALNESMRQRLFHALQAYQRALQKKGLLDWGDVPRRIWHHLKNGQLRAPRYDVILVDEAQFFAPIWFEIIKQHLKPETGHLFLVADPSQGFLRRRQSWLASGLEVRGRSHHLDRSYRTTRQILDFATLLYRTRLPDDDEADEIVAPDLMNMPNGALPMLVPLTSAQDEGTRVLNEIRQLAERDVPFADILLIHADYEVVGPLIQRLQAEFGEEAAVDPGQVSDWQGAIRVCSLQAATGLEAPIVFLLGTHALYEQEQSLRLSESERQELIRDNTRKLYMACTRAGQRLILTYVGDLPQLFQSLLPDEGISDLGEVD